ncbi:MAG: hypothetical protein QXT38_04240, partial [Candidatus Aenigmatarchaeota archaeon]
MIFLALTILFNFPSILASTPIPSPPTIADSPDPQQGGGVITFSCSPTACQSGAAGELVKLLICKTNSTEYVSESLQDQWMYRRPITISNSGSALTDYQVLVTLDTASLISSGKMRSDCGDIRFT